MENNNKESFKLLGVSPSGSDSASEVPEFVLAPPRKKKIKRRLRGTSGSRTRQPQHVCGCHGRMVGLSIATVLLISWLFMITWLAVVLHRELKRLDTNVQNVVAGSQAFPDALQKCHSLSRDLQQNQTLLFNNFAMLSHQLQNLSNQLIGMQAGLQSVEERLKAAPELVNLPQDMQSLSTSVASFGSQIRDLNTTVTGLKNDNGQLQELAKIFRENVTTLKDKVVQLVNVTQQLQTPSTENTAEKEALWPVITQLTANMTQLNDTFNNKLQWVQNDQSKDHKLIVGLQDSSQNMSARLTTLEGECVKSAVHSALNETVDKLIHQITDSTSRLNEVSRQVKELQVETQQLENSASQFAAQPGDIESIVGPTGVPQQTQGTEDSSNQSISPKPI